jgi:hypothetical protein
MYATWENRTAAFAIGIHFSARIKHRRKRHIDQSFLALFVCGRAAKSVALSSQKLLG